MIIFVLAIDDNFGIGKDNKLPWKHIRADMKHFKDLTLGNAVLMGRKTFQSIGKALPGRENIVLTTNENFSESGVITVASMKQALEYAKNKDVYILGGATVYEEFLPYTDVIYLTRVHASFDTDTKMSADFLKNFTLKDAREVPVGETTPYPLTFQTYVK